MTPASPTAADGAAALGATKLPLTPWLGGTVAALEAAARVTQPAV
jgi:hypothetical protein